MKKQIAAVLIGLGLVGSLAACSTADDAKPTPSASSTSSASPVNVHNECEGKYLDIAGGTQKKFGSCEIISLMADNRTVTVGDSTQLFFEGSGNTIHAGAVGTVDFLSTTGNTLDYTGDAPQVLNQGENVVQPAAG